METRGLVVQCLEVEESERESIDLTCVTAAAAAISPSYSSAEVWIAGALIQHRCFEREGEESKSSLLRLLLLLLCLLLRSWRDLLSFFLVAAGLFE